MIDLNPSKGIDDGLPELGELHNRAVILEGLIEAMDELAELIGPRGTPIYAILQCAVPMARNLARDLDRGAA